MADTHTLTPHRLNWRVHPPIQAEALTDVLDRVGWVQNVIVNERTGHIIDGHLRVEEAAKRGEQVPVIYVDLTEDEERLVLATMDPLAGMATMDDLAFGQLVDSIDDEAMSELVAMVHGLNADTSEGSFQEPQTADDDTEIDPDAFTFEHTCPRCHFEFND